MQWSLNEIRKRETINFDEVLDLEKNLKERYPEVISLTPVHVVGTVSYEDGLYLLDYQADYTLSLPSTRSLEQVDLVNDIPVNETFVTEDYLKEEKNLLEDENVLILERDAISLDESVADNIILEIPLRVLTPAEEENDNLPSGNDWEILSEEDYALKQEEKESEKKSPFASLDGLFD